MVERLICTLESSDNSDIAKSSVLTSLYFIFFCEIQFPNLLIVDPKLPIVSSTFIYDDLVIKIFFAYSFIIP